MAAYVLLTVFLFQRGSAESNRFDQPEAVDRDPRMFKTKSDAPWPVRRGGWILNVYKNSLSIAFIVLFLVSLALHAIGGAAHHNDEATAHGGEVLSVSELVRTSQFWFESFLELAERVLVVGGDGPIERPPAATRFPGIKTGRRGSRRYWRRIRWSEVGATHSQRAAGFWWSAFRDTEKTTHC